MPVAPVRVKHVFIPAPPSFARDSLAYLSSGVLRGPSEVRIGPIGGRQGVWVEEGTTNLLTANQSSVETDTTGFSAIGGATIARDTTQFWSGSASLKVTCPDAADWKGVRVTGLFVTGGVTYTFSCYIKGTGQVKVGLDLQGYGPWGIGGPVVALTNTWQLVVFTFTPSESSATAQIGIEQYQSSVASVFYIDGLQLEKKPYPTTWIDGGLIRSPESLTIPTAGVLFPQEGAIEIWVRTAPVLLTTKAYVLWDTRTDWLTGPTSFRAWAKAGGIKAAYGTGTSEVVLGGTTTVNPDSAYYIAWTYGPWGSKLYVNGTVFGSSSTPPGGWNLNPNIWLGTYFNGKPGAHWNGLIGPLRISHRARTDAEIQAAYQAGAFTVDSDTTYLLDMAQGSLVALAGLRSA